MCGFSVFVHLTGIPYGISGKESASQCRRPRRWKFYPGSGRSPGVENGHPLQCSCLGNFMERGAWQGQGAAKSWTWLSTHSHTHSLSLSDGLWEISFSPLNFISVPVWVSYCLDYHLWSRKMWGHILCLFFSCFGSSCYL